MKTTTTTAPLTEQNSVFPPNYQRLYPNVHNTQGLFIISLMSSISANLFTLFDNF